MWAPCKGIQAEALSQNLPWTLHGALEVSESQQFLQHTDGTPFLWLGATAWGMTEWLPREDVDLYLDDRQAKGMNLVQFCLFWGKRVDYPTKFTVNPENPYGHKAFVEKDGKPDPFQPAIADGGSAFHPNDYWDHVEYCIQAMEQRGMYAAILPVWGRRYVNATHGGQSQQVFTEESARIYGTFLARRFSGYPHIIWVLGGDVQADDGFEARPVYRAMAEGLVNGATNALIRWDEKAPEWDALPLTYHPDGTAELNSSTWFHQDPWLDFNMIETYIHRDQIATAVRNDLALRPRKPTILGEGSYEGTTAKTTSTAIHVRRQAYQSFFAGAAGFTYGGAFDEEGNGPLFSPHNNWKKLLNWEGASQLIHLRHFLQSHDWPDWEAADTIISEGRGSGELEKIAVKSGPRYFIYFSDNSPCTFLLPDLEEVQWFNPQSGQIQPEKRIPESDTISPPGEWEDAVLIIQTSSN